MKRSGRSVRLASRVIEIDDDWLALSQLAIRKAMVRVGAIRARSDDDEIDNGMLLQDELFQFVGHLGLGAAGLQKLWNLRVDCVDGMTSLAQLSNLSLVFAGKEFGQCVSGQFIAGVWKQILETQHVVCSQRLSQRYLA